MSTPTRHRRQSPAVYRRRRLVLLLVVIVVVAVVWLLIAQPWRGEATADPGPTAGDEATSSASPTPTAETSAGPDTEADAEAAASATAPAATPTSEALATCTAGDVTVTAVTDQTSYASGQNPQFSISLTNTSDEDCQMNVGTTTQSFVVSSGSDTYWRSTDCQTDPSDQIVTITAGQTVSSATPITWDRTRSSVDTCDDANRTKATAGGASYHLAVSIGGISAATTAQFLLY
ncbi:MAG: hypothetical protein QM626_12710 [Microbacterium sp.]|uniref:hypothetical protein n=1 Tax=Microbacterium sp. TaxID=51671 RepID=UPI0039E38DEE